MFLKNWIEKYIPVSSAAEPETEPGIARAAAAIAGCEALLIGAGAGLSASAGFDYSGARFEKYFADFERAFGFHDMYSGGFCRYDTLEELWAFWSRNIWINRYMNAPRPVYRDLLRLVRSRDYFVITTNVDHCFQKNRFDKSRLFYTQGDYGLFQCSVPCHCATYDNFEDVKRMVLAQGFALGEGNVLQPPASGKPKMRVPSSLIPRCPKCGKPMTMNLRTDDTFVEDDGWHAAAARYDAFCRAHETGRVVYLELGVGSNTPGIVKYPFMQRVFKNPDALYIVLNAEPQRIPDEIAPRTVQLAGDIGATLRALLEASQK